MEYFWNQSNVFIFDPTHLNYEIKLFYFIRYKYIYIYNVFNLQVKLGF